MRFLVLFAALFSQYAHAGDGGHSNYSCVSGSGRTVLSVYMDHYSGSETPYKVRLLVDGALADYRSESNESENIRYDWDRKLLIVTEKNREVLRLSLGDSYKSPQTATIHAGYKDPRQAEYGFSNNEEAISVTCRVHFEGP